MQELSRKKKSLFWLTLLGLLSLFCEIASWGTLALLAGLRGLEYAPVPAAELLPKHKAAIQRLLDDSSGFLMHSPILGWEPRPDTARRYRINRQGLRGDQDYAAEPDPRRVRIVTFGDSFTFGAQVPRAFTFQEQMMELEPVVEVLNFGVPGYGLDQAFLRYQESGVGFRSHIVFIGFLSENIHRVVNVFRPFYFRKTRLPLTKPRFLIRFGRLVVAENPLPELSDYRELLEDPEPALRRIGAHDYFFHRKMRASRGDFLPSVRLVRLAAQELFPREDILKDGYYNTEGEAYRVTAAIIDAFYAMVAEKGSVPVVVIFPDREDIYRYRENGTREYQPLLEHLRARGYRHLDLMEAFDTFGRDHAVRELTRIHYTGFGNRCVARYMVDYLRAHDLIRTRSLP